MATESIEKVEALLGSKVGEYIDIIEGTNPSIKPLTTIYGCECVTNIFSLETTDEYFKDIKSLYSTDKPTIYSYKIDYFGDIAGLSAVIKVETTYNNILHYQMFSQIYSPSFEELGIIYPKDEDNNSILLLGGNMSTIHLNKVYEKLKEMGFEIKKESNTKPVKELKKEEIKK